MELVLAHKSHLIHHYFAGQSVVAFQSIFLLIPQLKLATTDMCLKGTTVPNFMLHSKK